MASSTKMTLTLTFAETEVTANALKAARSNAVHSAQYRMNRLQREAQIPWLDIPKPAASTLTYSIPLYYEWEEFYEEVKKISVLNGLLSEFGFKTEFPEAEDFVPKVEEPVEEPVEEVSEDA